MLFQIVIFSILLNFSISQEYKSICPETFEYVKGGKKTYGMIYYKHAEFNRHYGVEIRMTYWGTVNQVCLTYFRNYL